MMKESIRKYHHNGVIKHEISYHDNGSKMPEALYDENGKHHREENMPDYQYWYENGMLARKLYAIHGQDHNINGPADISIESNGKILWKKYYYFKKNWLAYTKLVWQNKIKNI